MNFTQQNRAFLYGDAVFETLKIVNGKILFLEDHYFRLMASMRVVRMEIPMDFTMEFFENEILNVVKNQNVLESARCRITVYRDSDGFYLPKSNEIKYEITAAPLVNKLYVLNSEKYEVELYKDFYVAKHLLNTLKTNNKIINITGSIFANENNFDNCFLLNEDKNVVEALNGNIFLIFGSILKTPPISDGCLKGIIRKQVVEIATNMPEFTFKEESISTFDIQKADEIFITNVISGIVSISKYRKKEFTKQITEKILEKLNQKIN